MRIDSAMQPEVNYLPDDQPNEPSSYVNVSSWLSKVGQFITDRLFQPAELEIQTTYDRCGNLWWYVYDPETGRSAWLDSEDEVRIWIEKNY
jgi:hypothetical protein